MNDSYAVIVDGFENLDALQNLPDSIIRKARMAISKTIDHARAVSSKQIRQEVNFSASYLTGADGKLTTSKDLGNLQGSIKARFRPTSLARFATTKTANKAGVTVKVSPTKSVRMPKAFLVKLPQGAIKTETQYNLGLAVRLKPDQLGKLNKKSWVNLGRGLYLLYGPSVSQIFAKVADARSPEISKYLEDEFTRLIKADF